MGQLKKNEEMTGMLSGALFDGALRRAVAAKLGIPPQQQVVKASKDKPAVPEYADGATAFKSLCTECHKMDRIEKATKDPVGWRETVQKMLNGSCGDMSKNINLITDYLVNRGGKGQRADVK
jgi:cytochrome c5